MKVIMKKVLTFVAVMFVSINASATVLTFDDVTLTGDNDVLGRFDLLNNAAGPGYGGLDWSDTSGILDTDAYNYASGYLNGDVSTENVLFNWYQQDVSVSSADLFDFNGAYFTGAWNDDLSIQLIGYVGGTETYNQTMTVDTSGPTWFNADFLGIDALTIRSFGGTDNPQYVGTGTHFAMDNFTFNNTNVPEPSILLLLGIGLIGLGARRCKA